MKKHLLLLAGVLLFSFANAQNQNLTVSSLVGQSVESIL